MVRCSILYHISAKDNNPESNRRSGRWPYYQEIDQSHFSENQMIFLPPSESRKKKYVSDKSTEDTYSPVRS